MKIVATADCHSHALDMVPDGDVFIHAGDICGRGLKSEIHTFNRWLGKLPHKHKIVVAGNHDKPLYNCGWDWAVNTLTGAYYLLDDFIEIEGVKFYGSPWTPIFLSWYFMQKPSERIKTWAKIPDDTDVLITHGPPHGILDIAPPYPKAGRHEPESVGCKHLLKRVLEIQPNLHIFGHIHEHGGKFSSIGNTMFVNVAQSMFTCDV